MSLIIERGSGNARVQAFASAQNFRDYANGRWGWEAYAAQDCDEQRLESALWAAALYMDTIPWVGIRTRRDQALCWPRYLYEPDDYRVGSYAVQTNGWFTRSHRSERFAVPADVVPDEVIEANILLARDILDGLLDPSGRTRPTVVTSVSTEAGSLSFARPEALAINAAGMQVRSKDPLYSVRRLISPWLRVRTPYARFIK